MQDQKEIFVPIEKSLKMLHLEQYVNKVIDFTQRYNNSNSSYYSPYNLIGKYEKYPLYGDIPEAYSFRTYGNWWKRSESVQENYKPQDFDLLGAEDYIILGFESAVVPRDICIYEIYNPGAIVRIWGKISNGTRWILLWKGLPQILPHKARKFHPIINRVNLLIDTLRIEFNQSHLEYHYSIEAVLLGGYQPVSELQHDIILKCFVHNLYLEHEDHNYEQISESEDNDFFYNLPYEVIIHIFKYLDLISLSRCARVNKRWKEASNDTFLYQNLNLKPYWHLINCDTLRYFMKKCSNLRKLDLSWCGHDINDFDSLVASFIGANAHSLTHLSLGNCKFLNSVVMMKISSCKELVDLRLKNVNNCFETNGASLEFLNKLVSLDLTSSNIQDDDLITLLKENPNLKHLIIDLCENLMKLDEVASTVAQYNTKLSTWSAWKTTSLTSDGVKLLGNCQNIKELDLGWCLVNKDPGDCLKFVAEGCHLLNRLILSEWRGLNDQLLVSIVMNCKELTQLDFLGILNITADICEKALMFLPKLRLLDISFCDNIKQEEVEIWRQQYPHITIQRSCQYVPTDYLT